MGPALADAMESRKYLSGLLEIPRILVSPPTPTPGPPEALHSSEGRAADAN